MSLPKYTTIASPGFCGDTQQDAIENAKRRIAGLVGHDEVGVYQLIGIARRSEQPVVYEPVEQPKEQGKESARYRVEFYEAGTWVSSTSIRKVFKSLHDADVAIAFHVQESVGGFPRSQFRIVECRVVRL